MPKQSLYIKGFSRQLVRRSKSLRNIAFLFFDFFYCHIIYGFACYHLININYESNHGTASEIGIRKAFGASSKTLTYQFIIENIVVSLIGSVIRHWSISNNHLLY
jgi:putative ABC transport system permease protein